MPQFTTLYVLGREYGLSIPDTQECARKLGLPWQSAVTKLNANQVAELRPACCPSLRVPMMASLSVPMMQG
ncbi:MAG: hypothetical protein QOC69_5935 [Mycobacterium sp.]|jgi:hypothetical protein|nr:hypothetical protein [Mycobacterium sp.]